MVKWSDKSVNINLNLNSQKIKFSDGNIKPEGFRATQKLSRKSSDGTKEAEEFDKMERVRKSDPDALTILTWWARRREWLQGADLGPFKKTEKLPEECGGCYWTNDRDQELTADSILVDNPYFILDTQG